MANTDAQTLEEYRLARDVLIAAISDGSMIVEYAIGSRRKRVSDPLTELRFVEEMIRYYAQTVDAASYGRTRNYAEIHRR